MRNLEWKLFRNREKLYLEGKDAVAKSPNAKRSTANVTKLGCHVPPSVSAMFVLITNNNERK